MKKIRLGLWAPAGMVGITILSGAILLSRSALADDSVVDDVVITVPAACTLVTDEGTGNTYTESMMNGQYKNDIGDTEFTVACNTEDSFAIYAIGYSNDTYGNNVMLSSDTNAGSTNTGQGVSNIPTGTATSGNTSQWAMKLTPVSGTVTPMIDNGYSSFNNVPAVQTRVASITNSMSFNNEAKVKATYAVYVSPTQAAATYNGKVKYTVVHPNNAPAPAEPVATNPGYISYNPNATGVTDTMGDQSITATDTSANLWASNFQRPGYGFAGWSETFDYSDPTKFHGPNETISFTAGQYSGQNPGLSLYAIWVPSAGNLQSWTGCSSLASGAVTALTDTRDNNTYAVAKLADGKCWMIENLRLDNQYTTSATDIAKAQGYASSFVGLADPEVPGPFGNTTANSLYSTGTSTQITISGSNVSSRFPRYNNVNTASPASNMTASNASTAVYGYGNYYSWPAAVADTSNYVANNHSITTSICPFGWHIPKGGDSSNASNNEFLQLAVSIMGFAPADGLQYMSSEIGPNNKTANREFKSYPNNFVNAGTITGGSASSMVGRSLRAIYWSSTVKDGTSAYDTRIINNTLEPGTQPGYKSYGGLVRCVSNL